MLTMHDVSNIWRVPLLMQSQNAHHTLCRQLGLQQYSPRLELHDWKTHIADRWGAWEAGGWALMACGLLESAEAPDYLRVFSE